MTSRRTRSRKMWGAFNNRGRLLGARLTKREAEFLWHCGSCDVVRPVLVTWPVPKPKQTRKRRKP